MIPLFTGPPRTTNDIEGNLVVVDGGGMSAAITKIPGTIDGESAKLNVISGKIDGHVPLPSHIDNSLPPYIRGGGMFLMPPTGYIGNEYENAILSIISGENEGYVHIDNRLGLNSESISSGKLRESFFVFEFEGLVLGSPIWITKFCITR